MQNKIYSGGTLRKSGNKNYIIISNKQDGLIEEIEFNSCLGKKRHYPNSKAVCLVCGTLSSV